MRRTTHPLTVMSPSEPCILHLAADNSICDCTCMVYAPPSRWQAAARGCSTWPCQQGPP